MSQRSRLHDLWLAIGMWFLVQTVLRYAGWPVVVFLVAGAGSVCVTFHVLRFDRPRATAWYGNQLARPLIDAICRASGQQPPVSVASASRGVRLATAADFTWAAQQLRHEVFGHDHAIDTLVARLERGALIEQRRRPGDDGAPLGVIVLQGPPGIGKRWLIERWTQCALDDPICTVLDLRGDRDDDAALARLFGRAGQAGELTQSVQRHPRQFILLEHFDAAGPRTQAALQILASTGRTVGGATGIDARYSSCLLVLSTEHPLSPRATQEAPSPRDQLVRELVDQAGCSAALLDAATDCVTLAPLDARATARVVLSLMSRVCEAHRLRLDYVDPELVAAEIRRFQPSEGFARTALRLGRWMKEPIHRALAAGADHLVLTTDLVSACESPRSAVASVGSPQFMSFPRS